MPLSQPQDSFISKETWNAFLELVEPEGDYDSFFSLLTQRIRMVLFRFHEYGFITAEDVASETIVRLLRAIENGHNFDRVAFKAFAFRIARNYLIDVRRHYGREWASQATGQIFGVEKNAYNPIAERCGFMFFDEVCRDLAKDETQLLASWLLAGMTGREIAQQLGMNEPAVRKKISRLRDKLKLRLKIDQTSNPNSTGLIEGLELTTAGEPPMPSWQTAFWRSRAKSHSAFRHSSNKVAVRASVTRTLQT